jgi:hypothetical protein
MFMVMRVDINEVYVKRQQEQQQQHLVIMAEPSEKT